MIRLAMTSIGCFALCACASVRPAGDTAAAAKTSAALAIAPLQHKLDEQSQRIAELEARLALLEQEARGTRAAPGRASDVQKAREPASAAGTTNASRDLAASGERLPVVPLPEQSGAKAVLPTASSARDTYRAALRLVRAQRWDEALSALNDFLADNPHDAVADKARYWRGEVYYAKRLYGQAIEEFQGVLVRFPASEKAADCLLKVGMSHLRLGEPAEATRYFEQVVRQYPNSDAARIASHEVSS